jgi:hypothetical protein
MRSTAQMAEALVQLSTISLSGDFDAYCQVHMEHDQRRLYSADSCSKVATPACINVFR